LRGEIVRKMTRNCDSGPELESTGRQLHGARIGFLLSQE
jgi:hypothetical protein